MDLHFSVWAPARFFFLILQISTTLIWFLCWFQHLVSLPLVGFSCGICLLGWTGIWHLHSALYITAYQISDCIYTDSDFNCQSVCFYFNCWVTCCAQVLCIDFWDSVLVFASEIFGNWLLHSEIWICALWNLSVGYIWLSFGHNFRCGFCCLQVAELSSLCASIDLPLCWS